MSSSLVFRQTLEKSDIPLLPVRQHKVCPHLRLLRSETSGIGNPAVTKSNRPDTTYRLHGTWSASK